MADAIIFDLDGVLANSISVVEKSWRIWAEQQGRDPEPILQVVHGRRTAEILKAIAPELDLHGEIERFVAIEQSLLEDVTPIPGALEFVRSLPLQRWAVGTSGERAVATGRLNKLGFPVPDVLVASEDVEVGKPDPEVYQKAAARLGVRCDRCLVFEDAPAGIAASKAAGMAAVGVLTTYPIAALPDATEWMIDFRGVRADMTPGAPGRVWIPSR